MREAQIWKQYVEWIGQGDADRLQAAEHFGVSKSTAQYHLELARANGALERFYSWTAGNQTGWVYRATNEHPRKSFYDVVGWEVSDNNEYVAVYGREDKNPPALIGG